MRLNHLHIVSTNELEQVTFPSSNASHVHLHISARRRDVSACSRWLEHKPGVRRKITSAIKDHAECTGMM